jgi:hypothetical protein
MFSSLAFDGFVFNTFMGRATPLQVPAVSCEYSGVGAGRREHIEIR